MGHVAIVVDDYDRAIEYYTKKLGFKLVEDTPQPGKRWVVVTPNPESDCHLLLARASNDTFSFVKRRARKSMEPSSYLRISTEIAGIYTKISDIRKRLLAPLLIDDVRLCSEFCVTLNRAT